MSFDIPLHVPDDSPEAKIIEAIVSRDHVTPEEAVRSILRDAASGEQGPALQGRGLFSSSADVMALDAAVKLVYEERRRPSKRSSGL